MYCIYVWSPIMEASSTLENINLNHTRSHSCSEKYAFASRASCIIYTDGLLVWPALYNHCTRNTVMPFIRGVLIPFYIKRINITVGSKRY